MRPLRRLGQVQMSTANTVGNAATIVLGLIDALLHRPLVPWLVFVRYLGW